MIAMIILIFLILLILLSMKGRNHHPLMAELAKWNYAHRGLHDDVLPENSLGAFRAAVAHGYGAELDVHLLKDGGLAVIHDSDLKRITGQDGCIEDLTADQLKDYHLQDTAETIPLFSQVLEVFDGQTPLIVEVKVHDNNYAAVTEATCKMLESYNGLYCLESFDPRCVLWLKQNRPDLVRGQLIENYFRTNSEVSFFLKFTMVNQLANFLTKPDFVAYQFCDRKTISNTVARKLWGVAGVSWTLRSKEEYDAAVADGWIPIFEGFKP